MTNDPLETLRGLTSTKAALENAERREWGDFRSPVMDWEGDIPSDGINQAYEMRGPAGNQRAVDGVKIRVINAKVTKSIQPFTGSSFEFFVPTPATKDDGSPGDANLNSEMGQMMASATAANKAVDWIGDLRGKHIIAKGAFHKYTGRRFQEKEDGSATDRRTGKKGEYVDTTFTTAFYQIVKAVGTGETVAGTQAPAQTPDPTDEMFATISSYVESHTEAELANVTQTLAGLQAAGIDFTNPYAQKIEIAVVGKDLPALAGAMPRQAQPELPEDEEQVRVSEALGAAGLP